MSTAERPTCESCRWLEAVPERVEHAAMILAHSICRARPPTSRGWPVIEDPEFDWCRLHEPELALDALRRESPAAERPGVAADRGSDG